MSKYKIGDRVKLLKGSQPGTITHIYSGAYPYGVQWLNGLIFDYMESELELIQPETQEPIPGKFYRTRGGDKLRFLIRGTKEYVYEDEDGVILSYATPIRYSARSLDGDMLSDIVGEWVDVLPAVEIKRWAVVSTKSQSSGYRRGLVPHICESIENAKELLAEARKCYDDFEIVELTGTLPERKVTK